MVLPIRLDQTTALRRFSTARATIEQSGSLTTTTDTLDRIERSLIGAHAARLGLLETLSALDPESVDRELKDALRRLGRAAPEVQTLQRQRQVVIQVQDEIDAVDEHVHRTVIDIETLAAETSVRAHPSADFSRRLGATMQEDLELLRQDTRALEAARRELEHL